MSFRAVLSLKSVADFPNRPIINELQKARRLRGKTSVPKPRLGLIVGFLLLFHVKSGF